MIVTGSIYSRSFEMDEINKQIPDIPMQGEINSTVLQITAGNWYPAGTKTS